MKSLWIILFWGDGVISKLDTFLCVGVISVHFKIFVKVKVQNAWEYVLGVVKMFDKCVGVNSRCWIQAYVARNNESTPLGSQRHLVISIDK